MKVCNQLVCVMTIHVSVCLPPAEFRPRVGGKEVECDPGTAAGEGEGTEETWGEEGSQGQQEPVPRPRGM